MVLIAPKLKIKMSIPSNAIDSAWPEPCLSAWECRSDRERREPDAALEFMHQEVFNRVVRECNMVLHPCHAKAVSSELRTLYEFRKQHFKAITGLKRNVYGNGVLNIEFEVYTPVRFSRIEQSPADLHNWFVRKYVQPLRDCCEHWKDAEITTEYDVWCKKVYGQLSESFRMMQESIGLFVNLSVEKA